jgi:hypothetical protein
MKSKNINKMRPSIKAKWVAALRSGEYNQTEGSLRDDNGFCCLGVLCNLHAQAHPRIAAKQDLPHEYMGLSDLLPEEVIKWAGLFDDTGADFVMYKDQQKTLPELNDEGVSFDIIADLIEAQL